MSITTKGPANKRKGTKKGTAKAPPVKKSGFDNINQYSPMSKTSIGGKSSGGKK